jgi:hypothetical protein
MMRSVSALPAILATLLIGPAHAHLPRPGTYASGPDADLLGGRMAVSWSQPQGIERGRGDAFHAQSWSGSTLGAQWTLSCGSSEAEQEVREVLAVDGMRLRVYTTHFRGGRFHLSKDGPWGDGEVDWSGDLGDVRRDIVLVFEEDRLIDVREEIVGLGEFDGARCSLKLRFTAVRPRGDTIDAQKPESYPDFLAGGCAGAREHGAWGDGADLVLDVDCLVSAEQRPWTAVKTLYR